MNNPVIFSETYLYKIHTLSNLLEKIFDKTLRLHADITLSQFMVLIAVGEQKGINQRQIAHYLGISAVAVKRQVDIAKQRAWLEFSSLPNNRGEGLKLTGAGQDAIRAGLAALEAYVFAIFDNHNHSLNLKQHLDLLLGNADKVLNAD